MMDPISDMLTRIRNAVMANKSDVIIPSSRIKFAIAEILKREKFVSSVEFLEAENKFKVSLKYNAEGMPIIRNLKRISTPGRRVYAPKDKLPRVLGGSGISIISTSQGLMTEKEARQAGVGGEILCEIF
ncbi:MAG TPA: 30S ribosomal protein S8 [Patescibacteria group bacterium]|nr:30S ribosomal protein S8 [Patescibacteria group bacterium]